MSGPAADDLRRAAAAVGAALAARQETLATAESCTGGLIAVVLTDIPGASDFLWGGGVLYSAAAKVALTGVDQDVLDREGTVSAATTAALAAGIRSRSGATYGLAVTGWAGPTADPGESVGDVHGALSHQGGVLSEAWQFGGDRVAVRQQAAVAALDLLYQYLVGAQDGARG